MAICVLKRRLKTHRKESMLSSILLLFGLFPWECEAQLLIIIIFSASWIFEVFETIFSWLCSHYLRTGLSSSVITSEPVMQTEKLWWWSSLWLFRIILSSLFQKAAELLIFVFIKSKPVFGQLNPASVCMEIQTYSSGYNEEQAQHPIPQPGMLPLDFCLE